MTSVMVGTSTRKNEYLNQMKSINGKDKIQWKLVLTLALGIVIGGTAVNVLQMGLDYAVTMYTSAKFMQWQDDQIKQYQEEHPGSHPETKDHPGGNYDTKSL